MTATVTGETFDPAMISGFPEPAHRWLRHAIAPGTPLWGSVELTMHGRIKLGRWRPFTARQVLSPPGGYTWAATARLAGLPVTGYDRLSSGAGEMRWRLLRLFPVLTAAGPDITRSGRLTEIRVNRWGNPGGAPFGRYPFGVRVEAEACFGGITIPSAFRAGWWWGTERQHEGEFFRAEITGAVFS